METKILPFVLLLRAWCRDASEDIGEPTYAARRAPNFQKKATFKNHRSLSGKSSAFVPISVKSHSWVKEAEKPFVLTIGAFACWLLFLQRLSTNSDATAYPKKTVPKTASVTYQPLYDLFECNMGYLYINETIAVAGDEGKYKAIRNWERRKQDKSEFILNTETSFCKLAEEFSICCLNQSNCMIEYKENEIAKKAFFFYKPIIVRGAPAVSEQLPEKAGFLGFTSFDIPRRQYKLVIFAPKDYKKFSEDIKEFFKTGNFTENLENHVQQEIEKYKMPQIRRIKDREEQQFQNGGYYNSIWHQNSSKKTDFKICEKPPYEIIRSNLHQSKWLIQYNPNKDSEVECKYFFSYGCSAFMITKYRDSQRKPKINIGQLSRFLETLASATDRDPEYVAREGVRALSDGRDDEFDVAHQSFRLYLKKALKAKNPKNKAVSGGKKEIETTSSKLSDETQTTKSERLKKSSSDDFAMEGAYSQNGEDSTDVISGDTDLHGWFVSRPPPPQNPLPRPQPEVSHQSQKRPLTTQEGLENLEYLARKHQKPFSFEEMQQHQEHLKFLDQQYQEYLNDKKQKVRFKLE